MSNFHDRMNEYSEPRYRNRNYDTYPLLYSNTLPPFVSDNREERLRRNLQENREAMDAFIREWLYPSMINHLRINLEHFRSFRPPAFSLSTYYIDWCEEIDNMPTNTPEKPTKGASAPGAPAKPAMPHCASSDVGIDSLFFDIENAIHYGNVAVRRRKIGRRSVKRT